ncbi:tetratricopeptide repeat (TPR)-like superfamily protein [Actinidia rufa]|uniref:Tetratricopeptide repeat (TPR)-like superfamily protein n=1 Tax=Actinidia rufa TaxID=165716 RepID=A0A7J0GFU8_9ERIC|nr:tetratricopeptide repeat (TPR)-like superfamily protein [Actinidia rufa]
MLCRFVRSGNFAFSIALKLCTKLYELRVGRVIHDQIVKANEDPDQVVYNALLRLYAECGCFKDVLWAFNEMPERDIATWNSFIGGYVKLDQLLEAFDTFRSMQGEGVGFSWVTLTTMLPHLDSGLCPDGITFVALLSGCSHAGLTNEGQALFDRMKTEFGISPSLEHYACLVDIYLERGESRRGDGSSEEHANEADWQRMGSLLNSCRLHGKVPLA